MANSVIPIVQGLLYQESIFWLHAARMLAPSSNISSIGWEVDDVTGFDDVLVTYDPGILDKNTSESVVADFYQVKHHADHSRSFSVDALIDPTFIGATSNSLLQKLKHQQAKQSHLPGKARYILINTWGVDPTDKIGKLLGADGIIRRDVLMSGSDNSEMGRIRKKWREHLQFQTDEQLLDCLSSLRIRPNYFDVHGITEFINPSLQLAGLYSFPENQVSNKYDGLIPRLHGQKRNMFTTDSFRQLCREEGLFAPSSPEYSHRVGIRTFMPGTDYFEQQNNDTLCLVKHYDERKIKDPGLWRTAVLPNIRSFIETVTAKEKKITLSLDTHLSLAFATGYYLSPKLGTEVAVNQKTKNSTILWKPNFDNEFPADTISIDQTKLNPSGNDIAVGISITHDVSADVNAFVLDQLPMVGRIFDVKIKPGPSQVALRDGTHVLNVAQTIAREIHTSRTISERSGKVHIFMAAPNAFAFYFGQYATALGNMVLYEFNFPASKAGDYTPVLTFPN